MFTTSILSRSVLSFARKAAPSRLVSRRFTAEVAKTPATPEKSVEQLVEECAKERNLSTADFKDITLRELSEMGYNSQHVEVFRKLMNGAHVSTVDMEATAARSAQLEPILLARTGQQSQYISSTPELLSHWRNIIDKQASQTAKNVESSIENNMIRDVKNKLAITADEVEIEQFNRTIARSKIVQGQKQHFEAPHKSELPPGDWRDEPLTMNLARLNNPENLYERFIAKEIKRTGGEASPYLNLTKGQFIVHMRRVWHEHLGYKMMRRFLLFGGIAFMVTLYGYNAAYPINCLRGKTSRQEESFTSMLSDQSQCLHTLFGKNNTLPVHTKYTEKMDKFFNEDPAIIAQLPYGYQVVYDEYRQQYKDAIEKGSAYMPQHSMDADHKLEELMKTHNLTLDEVKSILSSCSLEKIAQQTNQLPGIIRHAHDYDVINTINKQHNGLVKPDELRKIADIDTYLDYSLKADAYQLKEQYHQQSL